MRRRTLLTTFGTAALGVAGYARFVESSWLKTTHRQVQLPGLPAGKPIRLVHLADLHASDCVPPALIESAMALAVAQRPDFVCITGDFVTSARGGYDRRWYRSTLDSLSRRVPTYAVMGNHDGGVWSEKWKDHESSSRIRALVGESGIDVLHNQRRDLTFHGQPLSLVGVGDLWAKEIDSVAAFGRLKETHAGPTLLMSHNPDSKEEFESYRWDLLLSGHTHGGQVVVPGLGLSPAPIHDFRYVYGLVPWRDRQIHTTSGVGNVHGVRFNCRPEVAVLDLIPQTQSPAPRADRLYS